MNFMLIENYFTPAMKKITVVYLSCLVPIFFAHYAQASGMKLETSVVVVNTEEGEGVMTLKTPIHPRYYSTRRLRICPVIKKNH